VYVLPKHLRREWRACTSERSGVKLTTLTQEQASYIGVPGGRAVQADHYTVLADSDQRIAIVKETAASGGRFLGGSGAAQRLALRTFTGQLRNASGCCCPASPISSQSPSSPPRCGGRPERVPPW